MDINTQVLKAFDKKSINQIEIYYVFVNFIVFVVFALILIYFKVNNIFVEYLAIILINTALTIFNKGKISLGNIVYYSMFPALATLIIENMQVLDIAIGGLSDSLRTIIRFGINGLLFAFSQKVL